jgi:GNAT superfamily N-acetyltransferase
VSQVRGSGRPEPSTLSLRRAGPVDADAVADVLIRSRAAADIPASVHDVGDVRRWVGEQLLVEAEVWLATDGDDVVGVLALTPGWVEQLFVTPEHIGRGVGTRLLEHAMQRQPAGLQLWTFVSNRGAQRFYERHGFVEVERTDGAGNEERAPDIRYAWRGRSRTT